MHELTINLHIHTKISDGSGTFSDLASAALNAGVDVLIVTDHNILVHGVNGYHREGKKKVLLLAYEEIHDQTQDPQKNHLLVFGSDRELAHLAADTQSLINSVKITGGICFIAHPVESAMPAFGETDISWVDWDLNGYTGIELWNSFSEFKSVAKGKWDAIAYAYFPEFIPHGPLPEALLLWDKLTAKGQRVVAIGGSDAHALQMTLGPLRKVIFPYEYHFSTVNTHVLVSSPLKGELIPDQEMVLNSLASGHCFIGYDLASPTHGFSFSAQSIEAKAIMGDEISPSGAVTLQAILPSTAEIRLVMNGRVIKTTQGQTLVHITNKPGVYRIEAYKRFLGKKRGWIFSNPVYIK
jgi:hypothetical protein